MIKPLVLAGKPSVAIVYDHLTTEHGGAERVLLLLKALLPQAVLYSPVAIKPLPVWVGSWNVKTTVCSTLVQLGVPYRWLAPVYPLAVESLPLFQHDLVISVSSTFAKGCITKSNQLHLSYVLNPPRFLYTHADSQQQQVLPHFLRWVAQPLFNYLAWWDGVAQNRADFVFTLSKRVAVILEHIYGQKNVPVVYPAIGLTPEAESTSTVGTDDTLPFASKKFFLVVSRLVAYKQVDVAIKAAIALGVPIVIVGDGPCREVVKKACHSNSNVVWYRQLRDSQLSQLYSHAQALVMIGEEDFGITGLEAAWHGTPVVVHKKSGVAEVLPEGVASVQFSSTKLDSVILALQKVTQMQYDAQEIRNIAREFTPEQTAFHFGEVITNQWNIFKK